MFDPVGELVAHRCRLEEEEKALRRAEAEGDEKRAVRIRKEINEREKRIRQLRCKIKQAKKFYHAV